MDKLKVKAGLQDLIIRLQDAEEGYKTIQKTITNVILKDWMSKYSRERHMFHRQLEEVSDKLGGDPEVKTSFLGDLHRMFINLKLNNINDSIPAIIEEIDRGSQILLQDYDKVLELELSYSIREILMAQKTKIKEELDSLFTIKEELETTA